MERQRRKFKEDAVPSKFQNAPLYLSIPTQQPRSTTRSSSATRLVLDIERTKKAVEEEFLKTDFLNNWTVVKSILSTTRCLNCREVLLDNNLFYSNEDHSNIVIYLQDINRGDGFAHWIIQSSQRRCAAAGCKGTSIFACEKCNVGLHPGCFKSFHLSHT
ncbi:hypothetical protein HELRODRAFT_165400 [Helobdella robusta]|uniref:Uncharacterized protein n=1 Tax=Helobdella robusta TaxID=6412 RepID=T1EWQ1_HELRO|nr:hypothetical protein HELRODRAFT_165400 [Helobdella robusta]ESN91370.1 hypothetical protein HELRODRAFT_165400 [Helobdella robusta]